MKKVILSLNILFVLLLVGFLVFGALKAYLSPIETNEYENRTAEQMPGPSVSTLLDGTYQEQCESALADQTPKAIDSKRFYNVLSTRLELAGISYISGSQFCNFNGMRMKDGYILTNTRDLSQLQKGLDIRIEDLNAAAAATPDIPTYIYYVERDDDTDYATGRASGCYQHLYEGLDRSLFAGIEKFDVPDFNTYKRDFFRTDHHWNSVGSDRGYREVLALIAPGAEPIKPTGDLFCLNYPFAGARSRITGALESLTEQIFVYPYDMPAVNVTINVDPTVYTNYGGRKVYESDASSATAITYPDYYGYDCSRIVFDNPENDGGENLLVVGDSYDNAILWLLSGSFDTLHSIDLRNYETDLGQKFSYTDYIRENKITKILLIGGNDYFTSPGFNLLG